MNSKCTVRKTSTKTKIISMTLVLSLLMALFVPMMSVSAAEGDELTVVRIKAGRTSVNIRASASSSGTVITTAGELATYLYVGSVTGTSVSGNSTWYKLQYGTGTSNGSNGYAYIHSSYAELVDVGAWAYGTVSGTSVNVRRGPGTSYSSIGTVSYGTRYDIYNRVTMSSDNVWYLIKVGNRVGYIKSDYLPLIEY